MADASFPYLSLLVFLPAVGAFALALVPGDREVKGGAIATSIGVLAISVLMGWKFVGNVPETGLSFVESYDWVPSLNIRYSLGVDGISVLLILLTALLTPLSILCSWNAI